MMTTEIGGTEELAKMLRSLPDRLAEKYGKAALRAAARITTGAVQSRMPVDTGLARESVGASRLRHYKESGTLFIAVEVRKNFRREVTVGGRTMIRNPRKYMHLIEGGRRAVRPVNKRALHAAFNDESRFIARAKAVSPHPVFGPAKLASRAAAEAAVVRTIERGVEKYNKSLQTETQLS